MFSPVSLYGIGAPERSSFVDRVVGAFRWIVFLFQGSPPNRWIPAGDVAALGGVSGREIALVDFSPTSEQLREYLYTTWESHAPAGSARSVLRAVKSAHERVIDEEERAALERAFYSCLFRGDDFQPSIAVASPHLGVLVRRKLGPPQPPLSGYEVTTLFSTLTASGDQGLGVEELVRAISGEAADSFAAPRQAGRQSISEAFETYYDSAEEVLEALRVRKSAPLDALKGIGVRSTTRFNRAFRALTSAMQERAVAAVRMLVSNPARPGLGLEKIEIRKDQWLWRLRFDGHHRIHFVGSVGSPLLCNIGAHRLFEMGRSID